MLCLVRYLFVISTSVIDCLGRLVPEITYYVWSGTLNLTKLKLKLHSMLDITLADCVTIHPKLAAGLRKNHS